MNGYAMMADSYKTLVKQGKVKLEDVQKDIKVYEFLSTCDQEDLLSLVNSGAFNSIIKAYCKKALQESGAGEDIKDSVMDELRWLMDTKTAKEILE